ncbi:MAG: hypothetical protein IKG97_05205 [Lachnospiraceae bacterium]|nr:hypothetical protein [Lachnospiraceae bacterium]
MSDKAISKRGDRPRILRLITFAFESGVLISGSLVMMNPDARRPHFQTNQTAESVDTPSEDEDWMSFLVTYSDYYYMDVDLEGKKPVTMKLLNASGEVLYTGTGTDLHEKNVQLRLSRGSYTLTLSKESGFKADVVLD